MHTLTLDNMSWWRQRYPHWVWLKTAEEDVSMINKYGAKRKAHAKANNFRATAKDDSDRWDIAGVAGEWAASRYLNIPIRNLFTTDVSAMKDGDICDWIEVKTRTEASAWKMDLADNERYIIGKEDRAYIACSACLYPEWVVILGWAWGHELKKRRAEKGRHKKTQHPNLSERQATDAVKFIRRGQETARPEAVQRPDRLEERHL
jgi:hypothetical protein